MAKQTASDLKRIFEEASLDWVCPITSKRIRSTNTKAIEAHQEKLLKEAFDKEKAAEHKAAIKAHNTLAKKVNSFQEFKDWFLGFMRITMRDNSLSEEDLPVFATLTDSEVKKIREASWAFEGDCQLKLIGGPKKKIDEFKKATGCMVFGQIVTYPIPVSGFKTKFKKAYSTKVSMGKKLTEAQRKDLVDSNPEYSDNVKVMKGLERQISVLKAEIAKLALENEHTRDKILNGGTSILDSL